MSQLIGLGGKLRAGKDAVGDYLVEKKNFVKLGMSDALDIALLAINPWIRLDYSVVIDKPWNKGIRSGKLMGGGFYRYQELHAAVGYVEAKKHRDVREYLQKLGTEVGREMIDQQVWVNIAKRKIREHWDAGHNVVITAIRFPNEIDMVEELGGQTIWIDRSAESRFAGLATGGALQTPENGTLAVTEAHSAPQSTLHAHASENSVSEEDFRWVVNNNGTLEDLYERVETALAVEATQFRPATESTSGMAGQAFWIEPYPIAHDEF